jgi:hypothetical protein
VKGSGEIVPALSLEEIIYKKKLEGISQQLRQCISDESV